MKSYSNYVKIFRFNTISQISYIIVYLNFIYIKMINQVCYCVHLKGMSGKPITEKKVNSEEKNTVRKV